MRKTVMTAGKYGYSIDMFGYTFRYGYFSITYMRKCV
jgi:hypothetical protein